jgi:hypothetical protein
MLPDARSARGRVAPMAREADALRTTRTTVGKASGAQKIVCS